MAKFYIYYNDETQNKFCTTYEWNGDRGPRRYCKHIGQGRFTHEEIQLDVPNRILIDKRNGQEYVLVESSKEIPNLKWETLEGKVYDWVEAF